MTLPEILAGRPELAQSSTYRNLAELVEAGVVRRIITSDEYSHFELAEHLTGDHHHHLICSDCGAVEDFTVPADARGADRPRVGLGRPQAVGFALDHHRLDLVGRVRRAPDRRGRAEALGSRPCGPCKRPAARVVLLDREGRIFLVHAEDPADHRKPPWWEIPGGGMDPGESSEDACRRELIEETGITDVDMGPCIWTQHVEFDFGGLHFDSHERIHVAWCDGGE